MNIRSITLFFDPAGQPVKQMYEFAPFVAAARTVFEQAGYTVQTTRLATTPFALWMPNVAADAAALAVVFEQAAQETGCAYVSLGPAIPAALWSYAVIPQVLAHTSDSKSEKGLMEERLGFRVHLP